MLTYKATIPMNGDINMFALTLNVDNHPVNKMADNCLTICGGCASCVPQSRQVSRQGLNHVKLVRLQLSRMCVFKTTQVFFDLSLRY